MKNIDIEFEDVETLTVTLQTMTVTDTTSSPEETDEAVEDCQLVETPTPEQVEDSPIPSQPASLTLQGTADCYQYPVTLSICFF